MAATSIGSTGNHPYPLAKMPELTDPADIQVALRNYHYGQNGVLAGGADATAGIAYYLKEIQSDIADLVTADATVVSKTIVDLKGDLIVGSAADTVVRLPAGTAGYILATDINEQSGLKWIAPPQSATTSVVGIVQLSDSTSETSSIKAATPTAVKAAYDKASTAATTSVVGVVQLSDSTSETSSIKAATPTAVKAAYDKASTAATTSVVGIVQLSDSTSETSSIKAATPTAVKAVQDGKSDINFTIDAKTADYSLVLSDKYKIIEMNLTSTANTVTIPLASVHEFPQGSQITIIQTGSGQTTIAGTAGVTINGTPGLKLRDQYSSCTLIKRSAANLNVWIAIGDLSA